MPPHEGKKKERRRSNEASESRRRNFMARWRIGGARLREVGRREAPFLIGYGAGVLNFHVPCWCTEYGVHQGDVRCFGADTGAYSTVPRIGQLAENVQYSVSSGHYDDRGCLVINLSI